MAKLGKKKPLPQILLLYKGVVAWREVAEKSVKCCKIPLSQILKKAAETLSPAYCLLSGGYSLLSGGHCLLSGGHCLLSGEYSLLSGG